MAQILMGLLLPLATLADIPRDRVLRRLCSVAESGSYYWAWTHPWLDVYNSDGDVLHAQKDADGRFVPKSTESVKLVSVYQKYADGKRPLIAYSDLAGLVGSWHSSRYYEANRASLTAAIRRYWRELGGVMVLSWHMDHPYCTNGFRQASYRFKSDGENRNVIRQILDGTGSSCGTDMGWSVEKRKPYPTPREWFLASLKEAADFFNGLIDEETGEKIPVILRYPHECDGDWFWWGRGWCAAEEFRRFCCLEADYLRKACGSDQIIFAYTPDVTWSDLGKEGDEGNTFLAYYPGDKYVDLVGLDDYSIGNGDDRRVKGSLIETVRKLRTVTTFAKERGKIVCISECGGNKKRDDFWQWLHRAATADGVKVAFVNTWAGEWGTLPATLASEVDEKAFAARPEVLMEGRTIGFRADVLSRTLKR